MSACRATMASIDMVIHEPQWESPTMVDSPHQQGWQGKSSQYMPKPAGLWLFQAAYTLPLSARRLILSSSSFSTPAPPSFTVYLALLPKAPISNPLPPHIQTVSTLLTIATNKLFPLPHNQLVLRSLILLSSSDPVT